MPFEDVKPRESSFPPTLTLEEGQTLIGIFRGMDRDVRTRFGTQNVYYIEPEGGYVDDAGVKKEGQVAIWGSVTLDTLLSQVRPPARVSIAYTGKESLGEGRTRKSFQVQVDTSWRDESVSRQYRGASLVSDQDEDIPF